MASNEGSTRHNGRAVFPPVTYILGTGAAFGNHYTTNEMREAFHKQRALEGDTQYEKEFVDKVFSKLQFDAHSVQLPKDDLFRRFSRSEYVEHRRVNLLDIAERACRKALEDWGGNPQDITHLYWGTMTGALDSPTLDIALAKRLQLNLDVKRTSIEGMGCLTGYRLLNLAVDAAETNSQYRVLVVEGDLRSAIGNSLPKTVSRSDILSAALFRDAASSAVVGMSPRDGERPAYQILAGCSRIVPNSKDLVDYVEMDDGAIRLHLDKGLPDAIESVELDFVETLLKAASSKYKQLDIPPIGDFDIACHTGGPRILQNVGRGLGLDDKDHLKASWKIMKAHGNLSGASNMAVLDEQNKSGGRDWVVCISMGPGVCLEGLVLKRPNATGRLSRQEPKVLNPLGDPEVDNMVQHAIHKKVREAHISTNYQNTWNSTDVTVIGILGTVNVAFWIVVAISFVKHFSEISSIVLPLAVMTTGLQICACFRVEKATLLSFLAILFFHLGALVNLVAGRGYAGATTTSTSFTSIGTLVGTCLLTLGMVIFSYTSMIYQDWQYMVQHPILAIAFLLRTSTAVIWTDESVVDSQESNLRARTLYVDASATVLFFIGLIFGLSKAFKKMQAPWFTPPNYQAYGILLYGLGEVVGNGSVVMLRAGGWEMESSALLLIDSFARATLFCASALLLLDTARTAYKVEKTLDYSAPSTNCLSTNEIGLWAWCGATLGLAISGILMLFAHAGFSLSEEVQEVLDVAGSCLAATSYAFVAVAVGIQHCYPKHSTPYLAGWQATGLIAVAVGFLLKGLPSPQHLHLSSVVIGGCIQMFGSVLIAGVFLSLPTSPKASVRLMDPFSWIRIFHSHNYFLLGQIYVIISAFFTIWQQDMLCAVAQIMAGLALGLHSAMAWYVWSMTHTTDKAETTQASTQIKSESDAEEEELAFPKENEVRSEVDVLIIGAGPTGLLLASLLGRHGLKVIVVEKRPGPVTDARWTVINSASMEILSKVLDTDLYNELRQRAMPDCTPLGSMLVTGMAHEDARVLQQATTPSRKDLMKDLGSMPDLFESRSLGSKHAQELPIRANQSHQEAVLKKQAERWSSVEVLYGHEFADLTVRARSTEGEEYVLAFIRPAEEPYSVEPFTVRSRYVVGCDGPKSLVATKLQILYDGFLNLAKTRSVLARAPGLYEKTLDNIGATFMYQIVRPKFGFAGVVVADPVEHIWNFLMMFGEKTRNCSSQKICEEFLGTEDVEVLQDRFWYWNFFIARQFRHGPGFLAGDSAHSWPPFGATGGNQGYGDAFNLGWKLAAVVKGWGGHRLLESYSTERRQAAVQTALFVLNHSPRPNLITRLLPFSDLPVIRGWFANLWTYLNSGDHNLNHFSQAGTQLGTKYKFSPTLCSEAVASFADDPFCQYSPVIYNGGRLPFVQTTELSSHEDPKAATIPIYDLVALEGFTLFVVKKDCDKNLDEVKRMSGSGVWMTDAVTELFVETFCAKGSKIQVEYLSEAELHRIIEAGAGSARAEAAGEIIKEIMILVRPDHTVCWHWAGDLGMLTNNNKVPGAELNPRNLCETVADTVIGKCAERNNDQYQIDEQCNRYQQWLTTQFMNNLRPFMFNYPKALPIKNDFKESAVEHVKNSIHRKSRKKDCIDVSSSSAVAFKHEYDVSTNNIGKDTPTSFVMGASFGRRHTEEVELAV